MSARLAPSSRRALAALALVLVAASVLAAAAAAREVRGERQEPPPDGRTSSEILSEIVEQRDLCDHGLFETLGLRRDREALRALQLATDCVASAGGIDDVYRAFRHFRDVEGLEGGALEFLLAETEDPVLHKQRAATRALLAFGGAALDELRAVATAHPDRRCRQVAVGGLVPMLHAQRTPEALRFLIEGYRVPYSGPRELAVDTLAVFDSPEGLELFEDALADRDVPGQMKALIVEALGRIGSAPAAELVLDALGSKLAVVQVAAVEALVALGPEEHTTRLERLERDRDPAVRHAALVAQAGFRAGEERWREHVLRAARGRDVALRMAAAACIARFADDETAPALYALLADDDPLVRREAIRAAAELRRVDALPLLVARLAEEGLRLREELRDALELLTGMDLGAGADRWQRWWSEQGADYRLPPLDEVLARIDRRARRREEGRTQTLFYGIPIASDRVCFVLDVSGSMSELSYSGGMRIDAVRKELVTAIGGLPDGARFNLLFFDSNVYGWKRKLVPANDKSRAAAIEYASKQGPGGGTALFDALEEAFEDPDVDTVVLLSDGEPTEGRIVDPLLILEAVQELNALREVVIHTVSVSWSSDLLRDLARHAGGTHEEVR